MKKFFTLVLTAFMAFGSTLAFASSWTFTFFNLRDGDRWINLEGSFSGNDLDHDGVISLAEVTFFQAGVFPFYRHEIGAFSYPLGGELQVSASSQGYRYTVDLVTGDHFDVVGPFDPSGNFLWNSATTSTITPVSEPEQVVLLGLGLGAIGLHIRRKAKRAAPIPR